MPDRDSLVAALAARHARFGRGERARVVLSWRAQWQMARLQAILPADPAVLSGTADAGDLAAARVLGLIHWDRYLALPAPQRGDSLVRAVTLLGAAHLAGDAPADTPPAVQHVLDVMSQSEPAADGDPELAAEVGDLFLKMAVQQSDSALLLCAERLLRDALTAPPAQSDRHWDLERDLLSAVVMRTHQDGPLAEFDSALTGLRALAERAPDPGRRTALVRMAAALSLEQAQLTRDLTRIETVIALLTPEEPPSADGLTLPPQESFLLGTAVYLKAEETRGSDPLSRALVLLRAACSGGGDPTFSRVAAFGLGSALVLQTTRTGDRNSLAEALELYERTLAEPSPNSALLPAELMSHGRALRIKGELENDPDASERAIAVLRSAVAASPTAQARPLMLATLAEALFMNAATPEADLSARLSEGIAALREAIATEPGIGGRGYVYGINLASALARRHEAMGHAPDLTEAIETAQRVLSTLPAQHPARPLAESVLGKCLNIAAGGEGSDHSLLDAAVAANEQAVTALLTDDPQAPSAITALGTAITHKAMAAWTSGNKPLAADLLARASDEFRRCAALVDASHVMFPIACNNLGAALQRQSRLAAGTPQEVALLAEAMPLLRKSVEPRSDADWQDDSARCGHLVNLAVALEGLAESQPDRTLLQEAQAVWEQAVALRSAATTARIDAAIRWARLSSAQEDPPTALRALVAALELLPRLSARSLDADEQEASLSRYSGVAGAAAALAMDLHGPERALELLEQGRGVLFGRVLDGRGDTSALRRSAPEIAEKFERLRQEMDPPTPGGHTLLATAMTLPPAPGPFLLTESASSMQSTAPNLLRDRRFRLEEQWRQLIEEIRGIPTFTDFLRPSRAIDLMREAPVDGPVIVLNVAEHRSDALLLSRDNIDHLPLPKVTPSALQQQLDLFGAALDTLFKDTGTTTERLHAEHRITEVLGWLWDCVTGPVLDHLGLTAPVSTDEELARVWWCPTRGLSLLPLHAAGRPGPGSHAVMDRVVSSYVPSLRALRHAHRSKPAVAAGAARGTGRLLIVSTDPERSGDVSLPAVQRETRRLKERFPDATSLSSAAATPKATLQALPDHAMAHFACHARADLTNPGRGCLQLDGGDLLVRDIAAAQLEHADLAVLSACDTARHSPGLVDEYLHLTTAFQLAGYREVVGTLWAANDLISERIMRTLYASLTPEASAGQPPQAARALHAAIREIRSTCRDRPSLWAAHLHTGR